MTFQKLMWHNMMRSTKSQKVSILHYSIDIYIYYIIYILIFFMYQFIYIILKYMYTYSIIILKTHVLSLF